ncbi:glutathione peroxidase [Pelagibacteraceae bacterium]|nr:glutathione peroxidase [Pelagibacteraceae bacterium]
MASIYNFSVKDIDHQEISLEKFKGKTLLIVNVASRCGFTPQYTGLQNLYEKYKDKGFEILAFPCNQFGSQEKGTNDEIKDFCSNEYNVSFTLFDKIEVIGDNASPLFKKLTQDAGREIQWNFTKYLINKDGDFVRGFGTQKKPEEIEEHIIKIL